MTQNTSTLQTPFYFSLKLIEKSLLPLKERGSFLQSLFLYILQAFKAVFAIALLILSLIPSCIGLLFRKKEIPVEEETSLSFPQEFKMGVADSFFQSCGIGLFPKNKEEGASDWTSWIKERFPDGRPRIEGDPDLSKFFIDYLENPAILIEKLHNLGVSVYRFSLERSVLEPKEGVFDQNYIQKYRRFINLLKENHIQPFATLYHFVNPHWFLEKGGFEKEENIESFVLYCEKMVEAFGDIVSHFTTINEPVIYAMQGYLKGNYPPGIKKFKTFAKVVKNLLIAHCQVYERIKKQNPSLQIGITHNWLFFQPYYSFHPLERLICYYCSEFTHYAVLRFFQTGRFSLQIPFTINIEHQETKAPHSFDFMGVQYYAKPVLKLDPFVVKTVCYPGEKMGALSIRFSPEALKEVLEQAATLKKPIWVTETGSDIAQTEFFNKVFSIISSAIAKGIPIKGALLWTLRDNLEWDRGGAVRIGIHDRHFGEKPSVQEFIRPLFKSQKQGGVVSIKTIEDRMA